MIQGSRTEKEVTLYLEVPYTKVLGVFGHEIHLEVNGFIGEDIEEEIEHAVLIVPENIYLQQWRIWLDGKRDYCERLNYYCGVMGYVHPINPKLIGETSLNIWNENKQDMESITVPVYKARKFTEPGFEHG